MIKIRDAVSIEGVKFQDPMLETVSVAHALFGWQQDGVIIGFHQCGKDCYGVRLVVSLQKRRHESAADVGVAFGVFGQAPTEGAALRATPSTFILAICSSNKSHNHTGNDQINFTQ